jgi:hypothetical protein
MSTVSPTRRCIGRREGELFHRADDVDCHEPANRGSESDHEVQTSACRRGHDRAVLPSCHRRRSALRQWWDTVIHFVMGGGFVIFATSVFDFDLPRWVNVICAAAAGAFGAIFLLQGVSDLTHLDGVRYVAFDVLGHQVERLLPDVVFLWFIALLLGASWGRSRILGWTVMVIVVGLEIATLVGLLFGVSLATGLLVILLPFVWLLFESAKQPTSSVPVRAEAAAASRRH